MPIDDLNSRSKTLDVFEALVDLGFDGHSMEEISKKTGFKYSSVRRCLLMLQKHGWVVETPMSGSKKKLWKPGDQLLRVAARHKQDSLSRVHKINQKYLEITGEVLTDER